MKTVSFKIRDISIASSLPPDGTCIRDYVDVRDIARAHLAAANATTKLPPAMNIGTGRGASVREIIKLVLEATNKTDTQVIETDRRAGDPAFLCADINLAKSAMGFTSQYSLEESVRSVFERHETFRKSH